MQTWEPRFDVTDWLVSEKYDGVQARWDGERLTTRSGRVIAAPAWWVHGLPRMRLTGELWTGRQSFDRVSGIVRSQHPDEEDWRQVVYMVFDPVQIPKSVDLGPHASRVFHRRCLGPDHLQHVYDRITTQHGEGVVMYDTATGCRMKRKPIVDADGVVIGHTKGKSSVRVQWSGPDFTLTIPEGRMPKVGAVVKFAHEGLTGRGRPRFARYLGVRGE